MNFIKKKLNSDFIKNSSMLIVGTLVAQLFPFFIQPFLRRIFTPEEFGIAAVYLSLLSILTIVASFNYHASIILPEDERDSNSLVMGSLIISLLFSIFLFSLLFFFNDFFIEKLGLPIKIKKWLYLLPLSILINSSHLIFSNWLTRKKEFKKISINKVSRRFSEGLSQLFFGKIIKFSGGIILGSFIGDLVNFIVYLFQFKKTKGSFQVDLKKIKSNLLSYIHFPKYSLLSNLFSAISLFVPVIIVNSLYNVEITGQFDLSRQILAVPLSLISLSISQVFLENITSKKKKSESFMKLYRKILLILIVMAIMGGAIVYFYGVNLFVFFFGENWNIAGQISSILIWGYAIKFVVSPLAISFIALEELKINSIWQFSYFVTILSLYLFNQLSFESFLKVYVLIDLIFYLLYGVLTYYIIKKYERQLC